MWRSARRWMSLAREQEVAELTDGRNEPPAAHPDTVGR